MNTALSGLLVGALLSLIGLILPRSLGVPFLVIMGVLAGFMAAIPQSWRDKIVETLFRERQK